ncbi:MAG TPA: alanine racemase [Bacteroidota bacterium]|nr:alanine racemase [Bacteroidota bacterium]
MNPRQLHGTTRALVSLEAFRHNIGCVRSYCGKTTRIMAVVKANAYGHGMLELSVQAIREGVDALAVARVREALEIRESGILHPLLVFEVPPDALIDAALAAGIELSVSTVEGARAISGAASAGRGTAPIHVKVDTGMGRLGFSDATAPEEIASVLRLPHLELAGIYSHFATSEDPDQTFALSQLTRFHEVIERLRRMGIEAPLKHMANSGAVVSMPGSHLDMVRPGIMLYGYLPSPSMPGRFPLRPVMSLVSTISMLRTVGDGTSISYGRRYTTKGSTTIATVPAGYADGYSRLLTNRASALIRGNLYPVVGTICMDHLMIDVGRDTPCQAGDTVTLIGSDGNRSISAWDIASTLGTIPYEVTSLITDRIPRVFVG